MNKLVKWLSDIGIIEGGRKGNSSVFAWDDMSDTQVETAMITLFGRMRSDEVGIYFDNVTARDAVVVSQSFKEGFLSDKPWAELDDFVSQFSWAWSKHSGTEALGRAVLLYHLHLKNMFARSNLHVEASIVLRVVHVLGWRDATLLIDRFIEGNGQNPVPFATEPRYANWLRVGFQYAKMTNIDKALLAVPLIRSGASVNAIAVVNSHEIDLSLLDSLLNGSV